jgi:hypothetical protein
MLCDKNFRKGMPLKKLTKRLIMNEGVFLFSLFATFKQSGEKFYGIRRLSHQS